MTAGAASGLDFAAAIAAGADDLPTSPVLMRDGWPMPVRRRTGPPGAPLVVLLHGSGWHGGQFARLGPRLAARADVAIPDLRGHGAGAAARGGRRGHLAYPGQMVDDVADLIAAVARPGQRVVLGGHSSGAGLAMRVAATLPDLAAVVLLAPYLGHRAPTTKARSGGWARPEVPRIVVLSALNAIGITALNHLTVLRFAFPRAVLEGPLGHTATPAWSYAMMRGFGPGDNVPGAAARLPPFLLIAGDADTAIEAGAFAPWLGQVTTRGQYLTLPDAGHLSLIDDPRTAAAVGTFLDAHA